MSATADRLDLAPRWAAPHDGVSAEAPPPRRRIPLNPVTSPVVRSALMAVLGVVAVLILMRSASAPDQASSRTNWDSVIASVVSSSRASGARQIAGSYLPGTGLVFSSTLNAQTSADTGWIAQQLAPQASALSVLGAGEAVIWQINSSQAGGFSRIFRIPAGAIAVPSSWVSSVSLAGPAGASTAAAPAAATGTPAATTTPAAAAPATTTTAAAPTSTAATTTAATTTTAAPTTSTPSAAGTTAGTTGGGGGLALPPAPSGKPVAGGGGG